MIALLAAATVVVLATVIVAGAEAVAASTALNRETAPFRWTQLDRRARGAALRHLRGCALRGAAGYLRAIAPATAVSVTVTGGLTVTLAVLSGAGPARRVLAVGCLLTAAVVVGVAVLVLRALPRQDGDARPSGGRFVPVDPAVLRTDLTPRARAELGSGVRERQQRAQQDDLDGVAAEAAAVLGRVVELTPEELRARVARQVALWPTGPGAAASVGDRAFRDTMEQLDHLFEQLERELADGVPVAAARDFWYTVVLRTLRHAAGPRALAGLTASARQGGLRPGGPPTDRPDAPREGRARAADVGSGPGAVDGSGESSEDVIDLRRAELRRRRGAESRSHRHEA